MLKQKGEKENNECTQQKDKLTNSKVAYCSQKVRNKTCRRRTGTETGSQSCNRSTKCKMCFLRYRLSETIEA